MSPTLTNSPYGMATTAAPCTDPCVTTCPSCGGLQCLCRPRFFAGQLLTEDDLGLLNSYIVEKNKLHNRYLHGWGVVCGMEVVCSPCNGLVTVKTGYALSPCGEDIIVCQDTPVDICALVQKCKRQAPPDCGPLAVGEADPCASGAEDWILFIRYTETMSRGVTPLKGASGSTCTTNCSCGGTSSCGCGGGTKAKSNTGGCSCGCGGSATTTTQTPSSTALAQCEPTAVCEGYSFDVCKAPTTDSRTLDLGALIDRVLCCIKAILPEVSLPPKDPNLWHQWCCTIRQNLLTFFAANPLHDCRIGDILSGMCNNENPRMAVAQVFGEYILNCICSALLPPCPCPVTDDRVPLATITIQKTPTNTCQLVEVCNLDVRKFATTIPALQYWLSPFGVFARGFRQQLKTLCCTPPEIPPGNLDQQSTSGFRAAAAIDVPPDPMVAFNTFLVNSFNERSQLVNAPAFALASLGLTHDGGNAYMSADDLNHPFETIFLNQVAWPVVETAFPSNFSSVLRGFMGAVAPAATPAAAAAAAPVAPSSAMMDTLKTQISDLHNTLKEQQSKLDELQKHLRKK
jgi:hypothetical protein